MRILSLAAIFLLASCAGIARPAGAAFSECVGCPQMVWVPPGVFAMGSPVSEQGRFDDEGPLHRETIVHRFAISRTPITRAQFELFASATRRTPGASCNIMSDDGEWVSTPGVTWRAPGFAQTEDHPVVCVSWDEATAYAAWLTARTGAFYRLLTEAEFEYGARAGASSAYPWSDTAGDVCAYANGFDLSAQRLHPDWPSLACDDGAAFTAPAGAFRANAFGLFGMTGNIFQWTEDCFAEGGYPAAGSTSQQSSPCVARVIRGGSWLNGARGLRAAMRDRDRPQDRYTNIGIRVARNDGG